MSYSVVEVFKTLQGEGFHAGRPAVFLRLAGCNMWNGKDSDRGRDAERNKALCPLWCDTDFGAKHKGVSADDVSKMVRKVAGKVRFVVITGGEPLLQLEHTLLKMLKSSGFEIAVETNGTIDPGDIRLLTTIDWVTCSPKQAPDKLALRMCDELKVVYPSYDPEKYAKKFLCKEKYVQPEAVTESLGKSVINQDNTQHAIDYVLSHPGWKLSVQTHKVLNLP